MNYNELLIGNIKRAIRNRGLKQCAVAVKAGLGEQELSNMLNGRKIVTAEHIARIANALGCEVNEFYMEPEKEVV